jgi:hypothetical protein
MAAKKTTRRKAKTSRKAKRPGYACPNPGKSLGLKAIIHKILNDHAFASFIRKQLCAAYHGDKDATKCVESYFGGPSNAELDELCINNPSIRSLLRKCTEQGLLINAVAVYGHS